MKFKNGQFSGKAQTSIGKMTAYNLNGANVFRSVPTSVKQPNTPEYTARKLRFGTLSFLIKALSAVFSMGTFPTKEAQNYRNPASTANAPAVSCAVNSTPVIDFSLLKLSKGSLATQPATGTYDSAARTITVEWTQSTAFGANGLDKCYFMAVEESDELVSALEEDARNSAIKVIDTTGFAPGNYVTVYGFVKSTNGSFWSDSVVVGRYLMA